MPLYRFLPEITVAKRGLSHMIQITPYDIHPSERAEYERRQVQKLLLREYLVMKFEKTHLSFTSGSTRATNLLLFFIVLMAGGIAQGKDLYHFSQNLQPVQCQPYNGSDGETLEFCILEDSQGQGIMPVVYIIQPNGQRSELWRDQDRDFKPWRIQVIELDEDALPEIALGVFKSTRFDPVKRKRLFIYDWSDGCMYAKWLGTRLPHLFVDFAFAPLRKEMESQILYAIEDNCTCGRIRKYIWNGFGFVGNDIVSVSGSCIGEKEIQARLTVLKTQGEAI